MRGKDMTITHREKERKMHELFLKKYMQNIILLDAMEELGRSLNLKRNKDVNPRTKGLTLHPIARGENQPATLKYSGSAGSMSFKMHPGRLRLTTAPSLPAGPQKIRAYIMPSFEDPKFDPQKIIDLIVSSIKKFRTLGAKFRELNMQRSKLLRDVASSFGEILEEKIQQKGDRNHVKR
jgi:hypothetical protein